MQPRAAPGSRRRRALRAAATHVRTPTPTGDRVARTGDDDAPPSGDDAAGSADPEVVALTADAYVDVADAHDRLVALRDRFAATGDRRETFLSVYARMTGAVADRVDRGEFADAEWVRAYLVAFANHYRRAVHRYETGRVDAVPAPWVLAFDAARAERCLVAQDAALGVNAHINYDLSLALVDAGIDADRRTRRADHDAVIDVIHALVDDTQDALAARDAPGIAAVDDHLGRVDEWLTVVTIDECRSSAWRTAVAMTSRFSARRRFARWWNAATATGAAHLIHGTHANHRLHDALADLERADAND
ncbi:DUF5995 family protein [Halorubellus salinus]|uniref:DUF5995 family protein n=1 Tax=Halorubellus salinus TaxID=755309 RepID=UPI001D090E1E|nr:DUF5995 family protein [Halorubellus salinus]